MLSILRRIRDRIVPEDDTYPDENFLAKARERYSHSLRSGNYMALMVKEDKEEENLAAIKEPLMLPSTGGVAEDLEEVTMP